LTLHQGYSRSGRVELPGEEIDQMLIGAALHGRGRNTYLQAIVYDADKAVATGARRDS
jgi:hypothetical protein